MRPGLSPKRLSLEHKLPIIIGTLLLVVIAALAAFAIVEVRRAAVRVASERLTSVTLEFRDLFRQSGVQLRALAFQAAKAPALAEYERTRSGRARTAALAALQYSGPQPEQIVATELRDSTGAVLLSTAPALRLDTLSTADVLPRTEPGDSAAIGLLRLVNDTLIVPIAAPVTAGPGTTYMVRWRRVVGSRRSRERIRQLVGSEATIYLGNPTGNAGSDLEHTVTPPPIAPTPDGAIQRYRRDPDRTEYLASATTVPGTPWMVSVAFPLSNVLAPATTFVRRIALIAALALVLGLAAAWITSRSITTPLRQLTDAASAISAGDYTRRVQLGNSDELGHLAQAFGTMADEVQQHRANLERKIDERTRDLNDTLRQLHDAQEALVRRERLAMLGQLSSGVGHELRNPLGVMTNAVYYLKAVLPTAPANVHEYLDILQQQISLSEKIVGDLLDFARSKPPQRKATLVREATDAQVNKMGRMDGVKVDIAVPENLAPVLVDPIQLGQIILNLLTNASQAMNGSGQITIRAEANASLVYYDVTDTGPGIPQENLEKVFEPLFTTKARGIGLGLAVSRTLAQANGGDLTVTSPAGQGATFRLTLALATPDSGARA